MDTLQKQINGLTSKVDALHQVIEQLSLKVSDVLSEVNQNATAGTTRLHSGGISSRYSSQAYSAYEAVMEHKDVLLDTDGLDASSQSSERDLAPEIQIRRLTAQLTAAYNRIAALEEQLLSQRIH